MRLAWSVGIFGNLCLSAALAQAQPTVGTFIPGAAADTPYTEKNWSGPHGKGLPTQGTASGFFYRLTYDGITDTLNTIAFDQTEPIPASAVTVDFDFRIGRPGTGAGPADGMGFVLLNTAVGNPPLYDVTGPGPSINEEAHAVSSVGIGLDTLQNNYTDSDPIGGADNDPSANEISVSFNTIIDGKEGCAYTFGFDLGAFGGGACRLHRDNIDDDADFDHLHAVLDLVGQTLTVTITPAPSRNQQAFTPLNAWPMPCLAPYPMRAAFGGHTGGVFDNHDIANVNIVYTP
jgi:hypothetical protein